jgi:predicted anti-sigma-YlaC factor YlaD
VSHLGDEEIQAYLDAGPSAEGTHRVHVETHLRGCPACRRILEEYRELYAALACESLLSMPVGARTGVRYGHVTPKIARDKKRSRNGMDAAIGALGIALAAITAAWTATRLGGSETFFERTGAAFATYTHHASELLASIRTTVAPRGSEIGLILTGNELGLALMAVIVIYFFLTLDYVLFGQRPAR